MALLTLAAMLALPSAAVAKTPRCWGERATIVGTNGDDKLFGTPARDVIVGLGGDDQILARGRDDRVCGKGGSDFLSGGQGDDRLDTGPGNNGVSGDAGDDVLEGGNGADDNANYVVSRRPIFASIELGFARGQGQDKLRPGIDELFGSEHGDTLIGDKRPQLIAGFGGDDTIRTGRRDDLLSGGAGNDRVDGGRGPYDLLADGDFGGPGTSGGVRLNLAQGIQTGHGHDRVRRIEGSFGTPADDVLRGSPGPDALIGGDGDDSIFAGPGRDLLEGDFGLDELDGGPGLDYSSSLDSPTAVTVDLAAGTLTGRDPAKDSDRLRNIEDVQGSAFDDTLIGDAGPNALRGDPGADTISGGAGDDTLIGDCFGGGTLDSHFPVEFNFDCSSAKRPDTLDGGPDADKCKDGETLVSCEKTITSRDRRPTAAPGRSSER